MNKEEKIIQDIRSGNKKLLGELYSANIADFIAFAKKYHTDIDLIRDIYQDAVIVLYENILNGKLTKMQSSIKTYLFAIGKYKLIKELREAENSPIIELNEKLLLNEMEPLQENDVNEQVLQLRKGYNQLGGKCKEVLRLFYYEGKKLDEIQVHLNYDSKDTVKSQKSRCLRQLKNLIKDL